MGKYHTSHPNLTQVKKRSRVIHGRVFDTGSHWKRFDQSVRRQIDQHALQIGLKQLTPCFWVVFLLAREAWDAFRRVGRLETLIKFQKLPITFAKLPIAMHGRTDTHDNVIKMTFLLRIPIKSGNGDINISIIWNDPILIISS